MATGKSPYFDSYRDCEPWEHRKVYPPGMPRWLWPGRDNFVAHYDVMGAALDAAELTARLPIMDAELMSDDDIAYRSKEGADIHWRWRRLRELGFFTHPAGV